jgi:uncharacterized protein (DUF486 family)
LQVPANRLGHADDATSSNGALHAAQENSWWRLKFTAPQLKILQEIITISVFVVFNFLYLQERIRLTDWAAFALIVLAVVVMMAPRIYGQSVEPRAAMTSPTLLPEDIAVQPLEDREV